MLCLKEKMYKFRIPRKNQHWVNFCHANLKVGPFGPPPVALGLGKQETPNTYNRPSGFTSKEGHGAVQGSGQGLFPLRLCPPLISRGVMA